MIDKITCVKNKLNELKERPTRAKTSDVRRISAQLYKELKEYTFDMKLDLCEKLLQENSWAMGVIAYDIAFRERKNYTLETFDRFEQWLFKYVKGWGDCDDFCTHAFGALLVKHNQLFQRIEEWCNSEEFWVRRGAAVILIYPINKEKLGDFDPLIIADRLLEDSHDLVQKGYGWMLKVLSIKESDKIEAYLRKNVGKMPRTAFRYALEKIDPVKRKELMKL